jgi:glycosyltransferase involved in cell wall biosynthesis
VLALEANVLEAVDRVIYVSNWARENVEAVRGLRTRSSAVVWNGVGDVNHTESITRAQLGLEDDDLVLINVGSMEPRKNQIGLLDLFATISSQFANAKLVLVGDGPQKSDVQDKARELKIDEQVIFLGHRRDVPALLPLADLYVHYASLENCPLVLLEAARASLPVAAVPTGGVPELLSALDCKYEIEPADTRKTLDGLRPLLDNREFRRGAGRRAAESFKKTFTRDSMTQAYLRALTI